MMLNDKISLLSRPSSERFESLKIAFSLNLTNSGNTLYERSRSLSYLISLMSDVARTDDNLGWFVPVDITFI
jgi:hypothetical protein